MEIKKMIHQLIIDINEIIYKNHLITTFETP